MSGIDLMEAYSAAVRGALYRVPSDALHRPDLVRATVDAIFADAAPLIEDAVREQIVREITVRSEQDDAQRHDSFSEGLWSGLNEARHIARGGA